MKIFLIAAFSLIAKNSYAVTSSTYTCLNTKTNTSLSVVLAGLNAYVEVKTPAKKTAMCTVVGKINNDNEGKLEYINFACRDHNDLPGTIILALPSTFQNGKILFSDLQDTELECTLTKTN